MEEAEASEISTEDATAKTEMDKEDAKAASFVYATFVVDQIST